MYKNKNKSHQQHAGGRVKVSSLGVPGGDVAQQRRDVLRRERELRLQLGGLELHQRVAVHQVQAERVGARRQAHVTQPLRHVIGAPGLHLAAPKRAADVLASGRVLLRRRRWVVH